MPTPIYSFSLAINATLDMHDLNNEGNEGNQLQTRMVDIVGQDGQLHNVNAISGDMLKHIQAEHFFNLARQRGLILCAGCQQFNPNRINADADFITRTKDKEQNLSDAQVVDELLRTCAMDDVEGILITEGGRSIPRKSVVEFGWAIGLPGTREGHNQSFFHVKYATDRSESQRAKDATKRATKNEGQEGGKTGGANLGQAIFHRPASSGQYAIVCHLEFGRIGYNDITQTYVLSADERTKRGTILLESLLHTFVQLNGAMRSAQLPHLVALEGALAYSTMMLPAPLISPLTPTYAREMAQIGKALGGGNGVTVQEFASLGALAEQISELATNATPFELPLR